MTHKLRWLAVASLMAVLAASAAACGTEKEIPQQQPTQCDKDADGEVDFVCEGEGMACDPFDGLCKCGGSGGELCGADEICVMQGDAPAKCETSLCATTQCERGMSCNPVDGSCHCGGDVCGAGEVCENDECVTGNLCESVVCASTEVCDPTDGVCKCGGEICAFGQVCEEGVCVTDACAGVNCGPGLVCNPDDGFCHCGGQDGPICAAGQSCMDDGEGPVCVGEDLCEAILCPTGSVCSPVDGLCHCGGVGPTNPVCGEDQTCDPTIPACLGGDRCMVDGVPKECGIGLSCDPEDGACKCGGLGGIACTDTEVCVALGATPYCAATCDLLGGVACEDGANCYLDPGEDGVGMYCAPPPNNPVPKAGECTSTTQCGNGLHCVELPTGGRCRPYCGPGLPACDAGELCMDLQGDLGACVIVGG